MLGLRVCMDASAGVATSGTLPILREELPTPGPKGKESMTEAKGHEGGEKGDWWTIETAADAEHRDEDVGSRGDATEVPLVIPHVRVPVGVWRHVIRLIDSVHTYRGWESEAEFVLQAIREKIDREIAQAVRDTAESFGVRGDRVRFVNALGEDTPRLGGLS